MRWSTFSLLGLCGLTIALGVAFGIKTTQPTSRADSRASAYLPSNRSSDKAISSDEGTRAVSSGRAWQDRWRTTLDRVSTPARDRELAALIEELALTDPQKALALAKAEANWRLRDILRNAALRGWASHEPIAAANWALTVRSEERRSAVEAVMQGAAANPAEAVKTALHLCKSDPEPAGDYGHYAIAALIDVGAFREAVQFGNQVGTDKYPFLLKSAFFQWSKNQPTEAIAAVENITDPLLRAQAYGEALSGWAWSDGKAVAEYALKLPPGGTRDDAFAEALPRWVEKDPVAATEWINRLDSGAEFDTGIEAIANLQSLVQGKPSTAMDLAGNITDLERRNHTLRAVFRQWATNDPVAARHYIENNKNTADRTVLADELKDMSPD
jgi:hypothetical protein